MPNDITPAELRIFISLLQSYKVELQKYRAAATPGFIDEVGLIRVHNSLRVLDNFHAKHARELRKFFRFEHFDLLRVMQEHRRGDVDEIAPCSDLTITEYDADATALIAYISNRPPTPQGDVETAAADNPPPSPESPEKRKQGRPGVGQEAADCLLDLEISYKKKPKSMTRKQSWCDKKDEHGDSVDTFTKIKRIERWWGSDVAARYREERKNRK